MAKKDNGGPVFPCAVNSAAKEQAKSVGVILEDYTGMTLRDYFAAKVLQGMWACSQISGDADELAKGAYAAADAMLKVRE